MKYYIILTLALLAFSFSLSAQTYIATHFDNDLLYIPANDDREYTYGQGLIVSRQTKSHINRERFLSAKLGVALFTPDNLRAREPNRQDRPYASLLSIEGSLLDHKPLKGRLWDHKLSLGALGLDFTTQFQIKAHAMTRNLRQSREPAHPEGWPGQISAGGEAVGSWQSGLRQRIGRRILPKWLQFMSRSKVELGFRSQAFQGLGLRWGKLHSESWLEASQPIAALPHRGGKEWFFYTQGGLRYQLYNALLQGQFRPSAYRLSQKDLEAFVWEGEMGAVYRGTHFHSGYGLHLSTAEYKFSRLPLHYWGVIYVGWVL